MGGPSSAGWFAPSPGDSTTSRLPLLLLLYLYLLPSPIVTFSSFPYLLLRGFDNNRLLISFFWRIALHPLIRFVLSPSAQLPLPATLSDQRRLETLFVDSSSRRLCLDDNWTSAVFGNYSTGISFIITLIPLIRPGITFCCVLPVLAWPCLSLLPAASRDTISLRFLIPSDFTLLCVRGKYLRIRISSSVCVGKLYE